MSRWNPCCCDTEVQILPTDMVLVRAGWHHFMVMTKDGKINTFISSGVRVNSNGTSKFLSKGIASYNIVGKDGVNVGGVTFCKSINELGIDNLSSDANLDPYGWLLYDNGEHGDDVNGGIWNDYNDPQGGLGNNYFGMITLYPEACSGWGGTTGISADGSSIDQYDGFYTPALGFANSPPNPVLLQNGCPYYDIRGNPQDLNLFPHGYVNFDGSGVTIGRLPGTLRQSKLIEARGLCGTPGITLTTQVEGQDEVVIPAPEGHPLKIPQELYDRLYPDLEEDPEAIPEEVIDIECGAYHNIVRLKDNSIVCWGLNSMGQCNVPDSLKPDWSRPTGVQPHPKKDKICSIHAGFSTTAVLFNDGTVLCWGDPDVADVVNTWEHIRVSPIQRHNGNYTTCCNGAESNGFIDPTYPDFPANKYKNGTYNANTDWFGLWRTGKPAYPHFDLGVETNIIKPVNWTDLQGAGIAPDQTLIPGYYCYKCNDPSEGGITLGKDFAVAMLRTGQIVTTRKTNARTPSAALCRDCSIDQYYTVSSGLVTNMDIGPNIVNSPECRALAASNYPGQFTYCPDRVCDEYKKWEIDASYADCSFTPEGIGCFSSNGNIETTIHDPNWAVISGFYTAGKQVRPINYPGGAVPSWNVVEATYGWSTKVAAVGRYRPNSSSLTQLIDPNTGLDCRSSLDLVPSKCIMQLGGGSCTPMCPSENGWGDFRRSSDQNGVPGFFSYPLHMAVALTCIAGTNTVNWLHSPRTITKTQLSAPISSGNGTVKGSIALENDCTSYHTLKSGCGECDYVGGNPNYHFDEIASTTTSCIYASTSDASSTPEFNPLKQDTSGDNCGTPTIGGIIQYMLPSKPWGPWQLSTCSGIATPPYMEMTLCNFNINRLDYCPYTTISQNPAVYEKQTFSFGGLPFGDSDNVPDWFGLHYGGGPTNISIDEANVSGPISRRAIRRDGGIWPVAGPWKSVFFNPNTQSPCYYPPECNNPPPAPGEIPTNAILASGRCPAAPVDPTSPSEPLAYIDCYGYESTGPCAAGVLGGQKPNVARYCYPDTFASTKMCTDDGAVIACGVTGCDQGMGDTCNRWFLNNPCLSYATGRMFGVFVRRSAWYRGISGISGATSGQFIWEKTCSKVVSDTTPKDFSIMGWDRLFEGTSGTKLWVTGLLHDPCPPWPIKDDENGITYGVYPSWVPVPTASRTARKGGWTGSVGSKVWEQIGFTGATGHETSIEITGFTYNQSTLSGLNFVPAATPDSATLSIPEALRIYIL